MRRKLIELALMVAVSALIITPLCTGLTHLLAPLLGAQKEAFGWSLLVTSGLAWGWYATRIFDWLFPRRNA